jgi:hypothetical protein
MIMLQSTCMLDLALQSGDSMQLACTSKATEWLRQSYLAVSIAVHVVSGPGHAGSVSAGAAFEL